MFENHSIEIAILRSGFASYSIMKFFPTNSCFSKVKSISDSEQNEISFFFYISSWIEHCNIIKSQYKTDDY